MAIGQESFWIIVDLSTREAITFPDDRRQSIRWRQEASAIKYLDEHPEKNADWAVVKVFA